MALMLRIRPTGGAEFSVDVLPSANVQDVKIAATAGCEMDPEVMKATNLGSYSLTLSLQRGFAVIAALQTPRAPL